MEIPQPHFGRRKTRDVSPDDFVRVELNLPAPIVHRLASESAEIGCSMSRIMTRWMVDLGVYVPGEVVAGEVRGKSLT